MNIKNINNFLQDQKFVASKKMGQNFLINPNIKKKIVDAANLGAKEVVLEIGPGVGAITSILLTHKIKLIAFELDKRLVEILKDKFGNYNNFNLYNVDALKIDWDEIIQQYSNQPIKLVANLPYSISSLLVLKILKSTSIKEAVIMVQKEMAERIVAKTRTHEYNMFSALVQLFFSVEKLFYVDPSNFSPKPKVQSCVIKLAKLDSNNLYSFNDFEQIEKFLKLAFSNKRKTLVNNLSAIYTKEKILNVLSKTEFPSTVRAEEIKPIDLVKLMWALNND